ncbi:hypothetical protein O181_097820 [Austropuccinia psidii MF-1]|uniref:Uncharacterized protein n=1 Tax=Austropuccinia psidii MF-1 TaxID=1389203 RepID=A0A9Q3J841_9BASI|nr:hypothetical protein [Austropuccinia psidii MF-1]
MAKTTLGPEIGQKPQVATFQPMASGNHKKTPAQLQARIPLSIRARIFLPQCTLYSRIKEWCIYCIIYHYAAFLLSNPMVTFYGPNFMIPNQVPNPSSISKEDPSAISVWKFLCGVTAKEAGAFPIIISKSLYHGYPSEPNQQGGCIQ